MPPTRLCGLSLLVLLGLVLPAVARADLREPAMVDEINRIRAEHDLGPLRGSEQLEESAFGHAGRLMGTGSFGHAAPVLGVPGLGPLGEALSLHAGRKLRRARTVRGWLRSSVHRALILSRDFQTAGAGHARGRFRGRGSTIWVLKLGG